MANPYLPLTSISFPSQREDAAMVDAAGNPTDTFNAADMPPSMAVDEVTDNAIEVVFDKTTDTVTSVDAVISGTFFLKVTGRNTSTDPLTWQGVWPAMWFDVYLTAAPSDDIDGYDGRSDAIGPLTFAAHLPGDSGSYDKFGDGDLQIPGADRKDWLSIPILETTVTITDPTAIALLEGASGTHSVYVKPRMSDPQETTDAGTTWTDVGAGDVKVIESDMRFIGHVYVDVNRA